VGASEPLQDIVRCEGGGTIARWVAESPASARHLDVGVGALKGRAYGSRALLQVSVMIHFSGDVGGEHSVRWGKGDLPRDLLGKPSNMVRDHQAIPPDDYGLILSLRKFEKRRAHDLPDPESNRAGLLQLASSPAIFLPDVRQAEQPCSKHVPPGRWQPHGSTAELRSQPGNDDGGDGDGAADQFEFGLVGT
jgi:hypothetical protein